MAVVVAAVLVLWLVAALHSVMVVVMVVVATVQAAAITGQVAAQADTPATVVMSEHRVRRMRLGQVLHVKVMTAPAVAVAEEDLLVDTTPQQAAEA
jgi:hypothetical protein